LRLTFLLKRIRKFGISVILNFVSDVGKEVFESYEPLSNPSTNEFSSTADNGSQVVCDGDEFMPVRMDVFSANGAIAKKKKSADSAFAL
jgi:hypothetical protein